VGIKTKVLIDGEWVEGEEVQFNPKQEEWSELLPKNWTGA
jgi:hypothetical protein